MKKKNYSALNSYKTWKINIRERRGLISWLSMTHIWPSWKKVVNVIRLKYWWLFYKYNVIEVTESKFDVISKKVLKSIQNCFMYSNYSWPFWGLLNKNWMCFEKFKRRIQYFDENFLNGPKFTQKLSIESKVVTFYLKILILVFLGYLYWSSF